MYRWLHVVDNQELNSILTVVTEHNVSTNQLLRRSCTARSLYVSWPVFWTTFQMPSNLFFFTEIKLNIKRESGSHWIRRTTGSESNVGNLLLNYRGIRMLHSLLSIGYHVYAPWFNFDKCSRYWWSTKKNASAPSRCLCRCMRFDTRLDATERTWPPR